MNGYSGGKEPKYRTAIFLADWKGYQRGASCPAVVVRPNWVLTANHCVRLWDLETGPKNARMLPSRVLFATDPVSVLDVAEVRQFWKGPQYYTYPAWDGSDQHLWEFYGDAALVRVEGSFSDVYEPDPTHPDKPGCYMGVDLHPGPAESLVGEQVLCVGTGGSSAVHIHTAKPSALTIGLLPVVDVFEEVSLLATRAYDGTPIAAGQKVTKGVQASSTVSASPPRPTAACGSRST